MNVNPFIITCAGMSGSKWFARELNNHPLISCSHNIGLYQHYNREYFKDELEYVYETERKIFNEDIYISDIFKKIMNNKEKVVSGNVHLLRLYRLKEAIEKDKDTPLFNLLNLVRHPLKVTISRAKTFEERANLEIKNNYNKYIYERLLQTYEENKHLFKTLVSKFDEELEKSIEFLSYFDAIIGMIRLSKDIQYNVFVKHIRFEKLLSDENEFHFVLKFLLQDLYVEDRDREFVLSAMKSKPLNTHIKRKSLSLKEEFSQLQSWKQELFRECVELSGIENQYLKLGYSFDFLL